MVTNLVNASLTMPGSTQSRTLGARFKDHLNVKDFGAKGDNVTDDTAAIQAAIDFAFAQKISLIYMPAGRYRTIAPIWLDPPGNARTNIANPPQFGFTMELLGDGWGGGDFMGTLIESDVSTFLSGHDFSAALFVGPGQFMKVSNLAVNVSHNITTYGAINHNRWVQISAICVITGSGGAHAVNFDQVFAYGGYYGFRIGASNSALGDSTSLYKCAARDCKIGFGTVFTQNFINSLIDCTFQDCGIYVYSSANLNINVIGGNFSGWGVMQVYAVSAGTYDSETKRITFHLDNVQDYNVGPGNISNAAFHDIFAIETPHTGKWALTRISYDIGSQILVLGFDAKWLSDRYYSNEPAGDIAAIISAITLLYGADRMITFGSLGIYARGVHIENSGPTLLARATEGWNVANYSRLDDIYMNYAPNEGWSTATNSYAYGAGVLGEVWPFIESDSGLIISNMKSGGGLGPWRLSGSTYAKNILGKLSQPSALRSVPDINAPIDGDQGGALTGSGRRIESYVRGYGDFDRAPFAGSLFQSAEFSIPHMHGVTRSPYVGKMPAPWVTPRLWPQTLDRILSGSLPVLSDYGYPPICGDTIYSISHIQDTYFSPNDGSVAVAATLLWSPREMFVKFNHFMWSWGQTIITNWNHRGGIRMIHVDDARWLFPGLVIGCDYTSYGGQVMYYIITEIVVTGTTSADVYVMRPRNASSFQETFGGVSLGGPGYGTSYTGTQLLQQPFVATRLGNLEADALTDAWIAGKTFRVGDKIWKRTPTASGSMGWICTTAGVAGSTAVFKAMPNLEA